MNGPVSRDELVGAALRELRVPEHEPRFWAELEAATRPVPPGHSEARPPRRPRRRWAVALAGVAAVALAVAFGLPRTQTPEPALATVVQARVADAVEGLRTLSGSGSYRSRDPFSGRRVLRFRFAQTAAGDMRIKTLGAPDLTVYDAQRGVERSRNASASLGGLGRFYAERSGVPPGPPDLGHFDLFLERQLGAAVRALLAAEDPRIEETTYAGRPAWRAVLRVQPNQIAADLDMIDVTVDQQTGLPVRVGTTLDGEFRGLLRLSDLEVNGELPAGVFDLRFPADAQVSRMDQGFRRVSLTDAAAAVGYAALVPEAVPAGFTLADVAVAERAAPTGAEAANPRSRDVVSLAYRRGFDRFVVSTRAAGPDPGRWDDPVAAGEGIVETARDVVLDGGVLDGERAELAVGPRSIPHLWIIADGLVVTIAGDLTADELVAVAESLAATGS